MKESYFIFKNLLIIIADVLHQLVLVCHKIVRYLLRVFNELYQILD